MLLIIHVSMNIFDSTCGRVESHVGDISLEEGTATQFDKAKLTGIDIKGGQLLLFTMERQTDIFLSPAIFEERQERFISKLRAMLEYADQTQFCREQVLLSYFGEKSAVPCGHCDVCRELARIILQPM